MRFPLIAVLVCTCICLFGAVAGAGGAEVAAVSAAFVTPLAGRNRVRNGPRRSRPRPTRRHQQRAADRRRNRGRIRLDGALHLGMGLEHGSRRHPHLQIRAYDTNGNRQQQHDRGHGRERGVGRQPGDRRSRCSRRRRVRRVAGTVTVAAAASDNVGVSNVQLLVDGAVVGSDSTSPYYVGLGHHQPARRHAHPPGTRLRRRRQPRQQQHHHGHGLERRAGVGWVGCSPHRNSLG